MTITWKDQGCAQCRQLWERGERPPELAVSILLHSRLHVCESCGAFWEQQERFANVICEQEARALYPRAFSSR